MCDTLCQVDNILDPFALRQGSLRSGGDPCDAVVGLQSESSLSGRTAARDWRSKLVKHLRPSAVLVNRTRGGLKLRLLCTVLMVREDERQVAHWASAGQCAYPWSWPD